MRIMLAVMVVAAALWYLQRTDRDSPETTNTLPEELLGEPDLYLEGARIRQYDTDGSLSYRLLADFIRHFETDAITRLTLPDLTLYSRTALPWQSTAGKGFIREEIGPAGVPEELVFLRDDVELQQREDNGRFMKLRSEHMYVYPDRQYAQTDRSVTIDTEVGRTKAAGMAADLGAGKIELSSSASQRVQTIVLKDQFK
ncbi:MAG: LPS export ABC transporter periplasmic protein LptC [Pseudomonadales bacterium]